MKYDVIGTRENIKVVDSSKNDELQIDIIEYQKLTGATNFNLAHKLEYLQRQHVCPRQVVIYINNSSVKIEPGSMSYFQGNLEMVSGVTPGNFLGRAISGKLTGESTARPEYRGSGMLVLEPTYQHSYVLELSAGEEIIVDKGMFQCAQGSVNIKAVAQKNLSSAALGGEGIFQVSITGPGLVVLESRVPLCEVDIIELENDVLKVDGNFAILRTAGVDFTVERSAKTLVGSAVSGEGLVNVYRGTGQVWLAPTIQLYNQLLF